MIRVFVSSVSLSLEAVRQQVIADLDRAGYDVSAMERFSSQPQPPIDVCLREVRRADVVVLVIGPRYGSLLPQGTSYTHAEYREARAAGIPVLAFRIPDARDLSEDDRKRLTIFTTEVGSTSTYDPLSADEPLERLSARILASLSRARDRGDLAHRYSVFQTYERFFAAQLGDSAVFFNHEGPFIGRQTQLQQLTSFIEGSEPLLLLKAPGGSGKSRLLLEAAKHTAQKENAPAVLFVDSAVAWSAEDVNLLPSTPLVLVFDDAHRRPDLDRIIAACRQRNENVRCVASCRPSAVSIVRPLVAQLVTSSEPAELDLPRLSKSDAEALARHFLGVPLEQFADRLVNIADRNPLVIRVGARCIADKLVVPEALERTPEAFRRVVLDRLLDDPGLAASDAPARRRILEVVSAVGPVVTESDEFVAQLATITTLPDYEVRRLLAVLERSQFLLRRGRLVRVSPDVLADHLLYKAAVDEMGKPTGFIDHMVASFGSSLESILANAAELDWRSATTTPGYEPVLAAIWRDMLTRLPTASNSQRAELVGQLKRAAMFAPESVLQVCEWITAHPDAPKDELLSRWGLQDGPDRLIDTLTDVLALIASHPDFTSRCAAQLWILGARAEGRPNRLLSDPKRKLADLVTYTRASGWDMPGGAQEKAIEFLIGRLLDKSRRDRAPWAVSALAGAVRRTGEANEWNRRVFTLREFSLAGFVDHLADRRRSVIECLKELALSTHLDETATALSELGSLLGAPRGPFGRGLEEAEIAVWQPEAENAIGLLQTIGTSADSDVIRYLARRELRCAHQDHWPQIAPTLQRALSVLAPVASEELYDLLIGMPWQEQLDDWRSEEERVDAICERAAAAFWSEHKTPDSVVRALFAALAALEGVGHRTDSHVGRFVRALVLTAGDNPRPFIEQLVTHEAGWRLLRPALIAAQERDQALAQALASELSLSKREEIRAAAIDSVQWLVGRAPDVRSLLGLTERLSRDPAPTVRAAAAQVLRRVPRHAQSEAINILCNIDWSGELWLANVVLGVLDARHGLDPAELSDANIDRLLSQVEQLHTLDGHNYEVLQFISFASDRRPEQTVDTLIRRVSAAERTRDEIGERTVPLPYNGHGLNLPGVAKAPNQEDLLRRVRDASADASPVSRLWFPVLFRAAAPNLEVAQGVLREWVTSGEPEKVIGAAALLRGFDHSIVFSRHELIAEMLVAANNCDRECLKDTQSELFGLAISGVFSGRPGEPAPRHLQDKDEAERLIRAYAAVEPVRDFYGSLVAHAEGSIRLDVSLWDEEDDD